MSYGYGGTGKASTDCKFKDYGKPFHVGDVIGALLVSAGSGLKPILKRLSLYFSIHWTVRCFQTR